VVAVTETDAVPTIWLRRSSDRERVGIVRPEGPHLEREAPRLLDNDSGIVDQQRADEHMRTGIAMGERWLEWHCACASQCDQ